MGACVLQVEDLGTSLCTEGNDAGGREKRMMQGTWTCVAEASSLGRRDEWDLEHKRRGGI